MFFYDRFPFWCAYFQELGFDVVLSSPTDRDISALGDELAIAQPCFPVKVAHGHVQELLSRDVDYVLVPNMVNSDVPAETGSMSTGVAPAARGTRRCPSCCAPCRSSSRCATGF